MPPFGAFGIDIKAIRSVGDLIAFTLMLFLFLLTIVISLQRKDVTVRSIKLIR